MRAVVTDHALVRWLERAHGMDMEFFRQQLAEKVENAARLGASGKTADGLHYVMENGILITVEPTGSEWARQAKKRRKQAKPLRDEEDYR